MGVGCDLTWQEVVRRDDATESGLNKTLSVLKGGGPGDRWVVTSGLKRLLDI
jgi:hypothetical protein